MKKLLFLLVLTITGCSSTKNQEITVTGITEYWKEGSAVHTDNGVYFIDNVVWGEKYLGKKVTVTGILTRVPNPEPEDTNKLSQHRSGMTEYLVIKNATWVLKE
ncbi:MAG: hypothetical protein V4581_00650 [Bacteroidota bacterium]